MTQDVVEIARRWLGTPYRHQASSMGHGTDCLGLIRGVWRELLGAEPTNIPGYTEDWSEPSKDESLLAATRTHLVELDPSLDPVDGDVLLFRMRSNSVAKHFGIASTLGGQPHFIHAYSGQSVVETALSAPWKRKIAAHFRFPI